MTLQCRCAPRLSLSPCSERGLFPRIQGAKTIFILRCFSLFLSSISNIPVITARLTSIWIFTQCLAGHWLIPPRNGTQAPLYWLSEKMGLLSSEPLFILSTSVEDGVLQDRNLSPQNFSRGYSFRQRELATIYHEYLHFLLFEMTPTRRQTSQVLMLEYHPSANYSLSFPICVGEHALTYWSYRECYKAEHETTTGPWTDIPRCRWTGQHHPTSVLSQFLYKRETYFDSEWRDP